MYGEEEIIETSLPTKYTSKDIKMRKEDNPKNRVCVQYDDHPKLMSSVLCSLMEHQSLVDLAIRCGNNTMHAHKCILAASSPYFREQLEKNPGTEQVIINGLDFITMKSVIEFIYCGETNILEEHLKPVVAAAKLFQIRGLQSLASETNPGHSQDMTDDALQIPPPIFMNKKPKYSSAYVPYVQNSAQSMSNDKMLLPNDPNYRRMKRKYVRNTIEAEKACAREARASRLALEALKKELGPNNQMHNFEIEDTCTETTVENFIPHTDEETFELEGMPLQVVNYSDLNTPILTSSGQIINLNKGLNNIIPFEIATQGDKTVNKIKDVFCQEMQTNVEIMYKTPEGEFVKVTDEVLRNITGDTLQFQVIDENGREGEIQLLDDKIKMKPEELDKGKKKFEETFREFINTTYNDDPEAVMSSETCDLDTILMNLQDITPKPEKNPETICKFDNIIADLSEPSTSEKSDHRRLENDDHSDILNEINSMQYYDKSVYDDVADKIDFAFQDAEAHVESKEKEEEKEEDIDVEELSTSDIEETPPAKRARDDIIFEPDDLIEEIYVDDSPKYSPRKTRSYKALLSPSTSDLIKIVDVKKRNKKK